MGEFLPMQHAGWMILTKRLLVLFVVLAAANEYVWRTQSEEMWVWIEGVGFPAAMFLFLWGQIVALQKYLIQPDEAGGER
jgi:intracellular septation protein